MQVLGIKFYNFFRFGEQNNSVVFDVTEEDRLRIEGGSITLDDLYEELKQDSVGYTKKIKDNGGITDLIAIAGIKGDDYDKSNGVGKSTVFEGICYAHYDKIVRKNVNTDKIEKAGLSVVTKFNGQYPTDLRESYVEEIFVEQNKIYRIKRGRTFPSSHKNSTPVLEFERIDGDEIDSQAGHRTRDTNEAIAFITPMDYDLFVNSAMFGQNDSGKFLTGTDKTRKEMLISLLRLEAVVQTCLENTRERKNNKIKDIDHFNAQIDILDENIKGKESIENLEDKIKTHENSIVKINQRVNEINDEIENFSKSDAFKKVAAIKEDGSKLKSDLDNQKTQKESQVKEWRNLSDETAKKERICKVKTDEIVAKASNIKQSINTKTKAINDFNLEERKNLLEKGKKAEEAKPKYANIVKGSQIQKEEFLSLIAEERTNYRRLTAEVESLKAQLGNVGGKQEFVCDKCKSIVSRSHIEDEIKKNSAIVSKHTESIKEYEQAQKNMDEKIKKGQGSLEKVNDYLVKSEKAKAEINEHSNNKIYLEEVMKSKEECIKTHKELKEEQGILEKQKIEYDTKTNEISKKYDEQIAKIQEQMADLQIKYREAQTTAQKVQEKIDIVKKEKDDISQQQASLNSQIGSLKKEIETITNDSKKLQKLRNQVEEENVVMKRLLHIEDAYGLEGIQTRIVKKYLPLLNVYIKETLDILSDGDMLVDMLINNRSKVDMVIKGGTADNFVLLSGGEKTLVRLSIDIALTRLSFSRVSQKPEIICLDEIFGSLDPHNRKNVFKLIDKLRQDFSRVILISHRPEINDKIQHKILIEKSEGVQGRSEIKEIT